MNIIRAVSVGCDEKSVHDRVGDNVHTDQKNKQQGENNIARSFTFPHKRSMNTSTHTDTHTLTHTNWLGCMSGWAVLDWKRSWFALGWAGLG